MIDETQFSIPELTEKRNSKIYSKRAIWAFSILFAPVFGGVLLRQNLLDIQRKKEANTVLGLSILFTVITMVVVNIMISKTGSAIYLLNVLWAGILTEYFYKKNFPGDDYEYKKIWKALIISILIIIPFIIAIIYSLQQ